MKPSKSIVAVVLALILLAVSAWALQRGGEKEYEGVEAPSTAAEMIVAGLGGFRGIVAEVVWFRADRLQDEARYAELAQLSTWLTFLEPHTPEVWAYAAWNLAYNISVTMPTPADRWRWVEAGVKLLRDDGLRLNPTDPILHRELAFTFLLKVGGALDEAGGYYRAEWKKKIESARAEGKLGDLGLDEAMMKRIDEEYGAQDWCDPYAMALYWAARGIAFAKKAEEKRDLRQIIYQSLMLEARNDARFAPRALKELHTAYEENPSDMLRHVINGFENHFKLDEAK